MTSGFVKMVGIFRQSRLPLPTRQRKPKIGRNGFRLKMKMHQVGRKNPPKQAASSDQTRESRKKSERFPT